MELERWDCELDSAKIGFTIIPFYGAYYGLYTYRLPIDSDLYDLSYYGYLNFQNEVKVGTARASAIGLPPECQFDSVERCKEFVANHYSVGAEWKNSPA
jgi:hypothetical protein